MTDTATLFADFQQLGLALAIGFLIGVERGWKQRLGPEGSRVAGLRTFTLIGLSGGLTGLIAGLSGPLLASSLTLAFAALFIAVQSPRTDTEQDRSATSAVAGLLTYALGIYAVLGDPRLAAAVSVVAVCVLAFKDALHAWLLSLTWKEIRSALLILASTFIALPLLPDTAIDPWNAINPRSLWLLTLLVASASFAGYVALRALGKRTGVLVAAIAGSLVSSTAVTADLARRARSGEIVPAAAVQAALIAHSVMLMRVGAFTASLSPPLFLALSPGLAPAIGLSLIASMLFARAAARAEHSSESRPFADLISPLDLREVGKFALILCALTAIASASANVFGSAGLTALALTAGLIDVDAITLSVARLPETTTPTAAAATAILLAAVSNSAFKVGIGGIIGGSRFAGPFAAVTALAMLGGGAVFVAFTALAP
jgi:uncharacterized membrane protein (DUF4010 family)